MNRDIKFRGKIEGEQIWAHGYYSIYTCPEYEDTTHEIHVKGGDIVDVDGSTVGQYIGLNDMNGVEIYEGDVCKVKEAGNEYDPGTVHEVRYWDGDDYPAFDFSPNYDDDANGIQSAIFGASVEIIGNIHDNPDLAGGGK